MLKQYRAEFGDMPAGSARIEEAAQDHVSVFGTSIGGHEVPTNAGDYVLVRANITAPQFILESKAGWHKSQGPSYPPEVVASAWVQTAKVRESEQIASAPTATTNG